MFRPRHDLDPDAMTDAERRERRCMDAGFVFETMPWPPEADHRPNDAARSS